MLSVWPPYIQGAELLPEHHFCATPPIVQEELEFQLGLVLHICIGALLPRLLRLARSMWMQLCQANQAIEAGDAALN